MTKRTAWIAGLFLFASATNADTPPDNFYAGGPDDYEGKLKASETWHLFDQETGFDTSIHPFKDHGASVTDALDLNGKRLTLRRKKNGKWRLIPEPSLNWTPKYIKLVDHPDWDDGGSIVQWRWINRKNKPINIDGHTHHICIGVPDPRSDRIDDDEASILLVDGAAGDDVDCGDPSLVHPGHANIGR